MNTRISLGIAVGVLLIVGVVIVELFVLLSEGNYLQYHFAQSPPAGLLQTESINQERLADWKLYQNEKHSYIFRYPAKLELLENYGGKSTTQRIFLKHSIAFENTGDCDMAEPQPLAKTLNDLTISFEIINKKVQLDYDDGDYSAGVLRGKYVYEGIEGCGPDVYYFPVAENRTLIVRRWIPQVFSGNFPPEKVLEIENIPGVILRQESEALFHQILSTFEFVNTSE